MMRALAHPASATLQVVAPLRLRTEQHCEHARLRTVYRTLSRHTLYAPPKVVTSVKWRWPDKERCATTGWPRRGVARDGYIGRGIRGVAVYRSKFDASFDVWLSAIR